ncbi:MULTISPECIES: cell division protein FtsA [Brevibacillus]|uniref:Cell division protein FtsA n=1 Tax=Brevibacillus brevis TaxID=1393 RepID=A0A2Z4ML71_BREBE|nr:MULTISPECIES: cell division protein FtsA [Brevibacillus]MED1916182.1 cell division protein FtsA [Bacillus thuringiensis]AWX57159.1 cell division protein FtsA [Brevibacillus brevis]EJL31044.1 cell division protein FtsA [Brevibacillus sp. BC25]NRR24678.1 cell division protein FtsA [Brevibacillus sp. MS2.2]RAT95451.1 cell division protein FtsA [Brevibacillus sp. Leaf182]
MVSNEFIVSLDIGTSKVRVMIGEINNGSINIIGVGQSHSEGIKKGVIVDIDQTVHAIREAVDHAERMVGVSIEEVYVGITGNHIDLHETQGVVAVSSEDREIREEDIQRVIQAAKVVAIPPDREIIEVVPKEYIVDGQGSIKDPRGMIGVRLEMEGTIVTGLKTVVHNIVRCAQRTNLRVAGIFLQPLAASTVALSKDDKNMGVVLVDIGAGSTTIGVFEQGKLAATTVIGIGGDHITSDISLGLRTHTDVADRVKTKNGCALIDEASEDVKFKVNRIGSEVEKQFTQVDLANIIEPRAAEIFQLVEDAVYKLGYRDEIAGGYVLTGGTVAMPGMLELAKEELDAPVRIAIPDYIGVRDPAYTTGVGLIQYALQLMERRSIRVTPSFKGTQKQTVSSKPKEGGGLMEKVKNWFSEFI